MFLFWCDCLLCLLFLFFFSSRRRHTRCALVTGVQTCALPISLFLAVFRAMQAMGVNALDRAHPVEKYFRESAVLPLYDAGNIGRSEERRVGKECVSTCRSRWSPYH